MALTDKQEMFCREYLVDLNATQAAIRAAPNSKVAHYFNISWVKIKRLILV
ncbi:terminase small subunit [Pantoea sp. M_5]|uniref:terminase small subunit n=1 Tax=Pantoea sp. M_5 TaxID=2608038 RepID=UPI001231D3C3|nr:terminase small subunit [Pantoea sp. M_5]